MDPSCAAQQQEMSNQTLETILICTKPKNNNNNVINVQDHQKKQRPQPEQALKCPRCQSTNTKFCYYNNYSLSQPRYFCKSCRRYWTKGGTLRNVPVGGGCRKNKRSSTSANSPNSSKNLIVKPFHDEPLNNPLFTGLPSVGYDTFGISGGLFGGYNGNFSSGLSYGFMTGHHHNHSNTIDTSATSIAMPLEESINKQEVSMNGNNENTSKVLWGFPWQMTGEVPGGGGAPEIDAGRENWNGVTSSWHGLLNSPLM